jgi:hypothetical protein
MGTLLVTSISITDCLWIRKCLSYTLIIGYVKYPIIKFYYFIKKFRHICHTYYREVVFFNRQTNVSC